MKLKLIPVLGAFAIMALSFGAAPAKATPSVSLSVDTFVFAVDGDFSFEEFGDNVETTPAVTEDVADIMDGLLDSYSLAFGLSYNVEIDDPAPATPRNWELSIDLEVAGELFFNEGDIEFDTSDVEDFFGTTFPITGIPIGELTGPFSVNDLAELGGFILDLFNECSGGTTFSLFGTDDGACFFDQTGPLSGELFVGLDEGATGDLLFDVLGLGPLIARSGGFIVEASADFVLTEVPEPGTLALFGLGLAGLGVATRRRRKARSDAA